VLGGAFKESPVNAAMLLFIRDETGRVHTYQFAITVSEHQWHQVIGPYDCMVSHHAAEILLTQAGRSKTTFFTAKVMLLEDPRYSSIYRSIPAKLIGTDDKVS
jgi:hypothetical protein